MVTYSDDKISETLTVLPTVVVLPDTTVTDNTRTTIGGSINTDTNFDCSKISLRRNSRGEDVKKLQTILKARGYYTRKVDGIFGKYTENAVKKLQTAQGNTADGWFGQKTCSKLQQISSTSNIATGTSSKKSTNYTITDFKGNPSFNNDQEGLTHDLTLKTEYTDNKIAHIRKLQKTRYEYKIGEITQYTHEGYINDIKINEEEGKTFIEIAMVGYAAFLDTTVEFEEKTAKRSVLLKELIEGAGLKANIDMTGFVDDEYTLKVSKNENTSSSSGGGGLTDVHGNDCTDTNPISARSYDIDTCHGNTKIGDSSANYAQDTKHMSAKEAILDVYNRFHYGPSLTSSKVYYNNRRCPKTMWQKTGKIFGNCADISRLIKALGEVHGLKVGIRHCPSHYYNLIEINGKTYKFDCCFKSGVTGSAYGGEVCNTLTQRGGPWQS